MTKYTMSASEDLTADHIKAFVQDFAAKQQRRLDRLQDYYLGKHDILGRPATDPGKPNNRIVSPYPSYIVDIFTGYFMGDPVTYNSDDPGLLDRLKEIYNYNDEAAENADLAKAAGIYGRAVELLYIDDDGQIRFRQLDPKACIPIYDNSLSEELLYVLRPYETRDILSSATHPYVEVYTREQILTYDMQQGIKLIDALTQDHYFGLVPVVVYANNDDEIGDFEPVMSEIDAYDKAQSDSVNELEYFADAYLVLTGMPDTDPNDIKIMRVNHVLSLPDSDATAQWLTKQINDTYIENIKNRLDQNIHKFSKCPAMTDEDFAANASGVAMKYKLMGLETATSKKERAFKKGLQRRIEIIVNMLNVLGGNYDYRSVGMTFTRNIPANLVEMADVVTKVGHLLSNETQIEMLPIDVDPGQEVERKRQEEELLSFDTTPPEEDEQDAELLG